MGNGPGIAGHNPTRAGSSAIDEKDKGRA